MKLLYSTNHFSFSFFFSPSLQKRLRASQARLRADHASIRFRLAREDELRRASGTRGPQQPLHGMGIQQRHQRRRHHVTFAGVTSRRREKQKQEQK